MEIDLKSMSRAELMKLKKDVEKALRDAEARALREARKALEETAAKFGYTVSEITGAPGAAKSKRPAAPPKYRNPDNPEPTWSGRGRRPEWMNEAIKKGIDPATMEI